MSSKLRCPHVRGVSLVSWLFVAVVMAIARACLWEEKPMLLSQPVIVARGSQDASAMVERVAVNKHKMSDHQGVR